MTDDPNAIAKQEAEDEMQAYDRLPQSVRHVLANARDCFGVEAQRAGDLLKVYTPKNVRAYFIQRNGVSEINQRRKDR